MNERAMDAVLHVDTLHGALQYLRRDRLDRALEALEMGLDVGVLWLKGTSVSADASDLDLIQKSLQRIRDYRRIHPRKIEIDVSRIDKKTVAADLKLQEQAQK